MRIVILSRQPALYSTRVLVEAGQARGHEVEVRTPVLRTTVVRHPGGQCEERPVVEALVRLGPVEKRIRLTVTNRAHMRCRMILGRQALAGSFLIDVSRKYLVQTPKG